MLFWQIVVLALVVLLNLFFLITLIAGLIGASFGSPFVPSGRKIVRKMIALAEIKKNEIVFDLGCGDGRIVFEAEKTGAECFGIEIAPPVWILAQIRKFVSRGKSKIILGNLFSQKEELKKADVIFLFLLPSVMEKFHRDVFPHLKREVRIVSHAFNFKNLAPTKLISRAESGHAPIYLFVKRD